LVSRWHDLLLLVFRNIRKTAFLITLRRSLVAALLLGLLGVALVCCYLQLWGYLFYHLLPIKLLPRILIDAGVDIAE